MTRFHSRWRRAAIAALLCLLCAQPGEAQYFGQNKVQYKPLDFQILKTEHFDIYFYPEERAGADIAARMAERWYVRLSRLLSHELRGRQPLVLYASPTDFQQTNVIPGGIGEGTGGVTEPLRRRIVLPLGGPLGDTDHVIGHELVHAFQFDITTPLNAAPGQNGAERLPLWFIEGMAEYLSIGAVDPNTAMWMRDAARQETLPDLDELDNPKYFPYRWGQAFWAYVGGRWGDATIAQMLEIAAAAGEPKVAVQRVLGLSTKEFSADWQRAIRGTFQAVQGNAVRPVESGATPLIASTGSVDLNIGPALSPDGRRIAFLSSRDLLSVDLYVADATTGKVLHKLTSTATDPHISSIEFIYSSGAWTRDSRQLAIATVSDGHASFDIFDGESGDRVRSVEIPAVDQAIHPAWAPNGQTIVFTGLHGGLTDLFMYDLTRGSLQQLTDDAFADLQPAWSPDGQRILFATDRFTTNLETLSIGRYRIATIDAASRRIAAVPTFDEGDSLNPQWAADGRSFYFLSNRSGIPNLYRASAVDGTARPTPAQLTNVATGVSGITASSPAITVASASDRAAFSVYENGKYNIYTLEPAAHGESPSAPVPSAAVLPPTDRRQSQVLGLIDNPSLGLPPSDRKYPQSDYRAGLSLRGVGQPTVALGVDRFGPAVGGGLALYFDDMLGNHILATAVQVNAGFGGGTSFRDTAAQAAYVNQSRRWIWGLSGGRVPYLSGGFQSAIGVTPAGEVVQVDQTLILRQTESSAAVMTAYPFSRAQRLELQGGLMHLSFGQTVQTDVFSLDTGQVISSERETTDIGRALTLATTSAALVYDTSVFGATSPVQGQRYRLEASPAFGSLNFTSLLADYRKYFVPVPFYTIATRVYHSGRYGTDAQSEQLFPLYVGYPSLVRGYDINSFSGVECVPDATSPCPLIDRLIGSRALVGNIEFRFPLLRPFGVSGSMYGPVPVEVAAFLDGGVTWSSGERPSLVGGDREGVASAGATVRVNLFGVFVGQFDVVRPFQRPGAGWVFQFNLAPGF